VIVVEECKDQEDEAPGETDDGKYNSTIACFTQDLMCGHTDGSHLETGKGKRIKYSQPRCPFHLC
jgi:hypothetical protein